MFELTIKYKGVPKSQNVILRQHFHKRSKDFKIIYKDIENLCEGLLPAKPLSSALICITRNSNRYLDYDNCVASLKPIVDGLVRCGVLEDDNYKVTGTWVVHQYLCKKGEECLEIAVMGK